MAWVVDLGLRKLKAQIDSAAPNRSIASDGFIGDPAHSARESDHNPQHPPPPGNPDFQVDAGDFTHDPARGADMGIISEAIRVSRDQRVSYIIFNRRITGPGHNWQWDVYTGADPHTGHMHVSVNDVHHDETQDWVIGVALTTSEITAIASKVWNWDLVNGPQVGVAYEVVLAIQAQAQNNGGGITTLLSRPPADVDEAALAAALLPLLLPPIEASIGQIVADRVRAELDATRLAAG